MTAEELASAALEAPDPGYGPRLAAIRATASAEGVTLTVDLHGGLVDLSFARRAMERGPRELASLVKRLAEEAADVAARQGREVLGDLWPGAGEERSPEPLREEEFTPASWATGP